VPAGAAGWQGGGGCSLGQVPPRARRNFRHCCWVTRVRTVWENTAFIFCHIFQYPPRRLCMERLVSLAAQKSQKRIIGICGRTWRQQDRGGREWKIDEGGAGGARGAAVAKATGVSALGSVISVRQPMQSALTHAAGSRPILRDAPALAYERGLQHSARCTPCKLHRQRGWRQRRRQIWEREWKAYGGCKRACCQRGTGRRRGGGVECRPAACLGALTPAQHATASAPPPLAARSL